MEVHPTGKRQRGGVGRGSVPRWSDEPLPWLAIALVSGVATAGMWVVEVDRVWLGTAALWLVAALAGGRRGGRGALLVGTVLLGAALGAPRAPTPARVGRGVVQGVVTQASPWSAVVRHAHGETRIRGAPPLPTAGARISARVRPAAPSPRLPGAPDPRRADRMMGRSAARVDAWLQLGGDRPGAALPSWVGARRHGGLLWALATGDRSAIPASDAALLERTGTGHLLAISGLHVGLVAGVVLAIGVVAVRGLARLRPRARLAVRLRWLPTLGALAAAAAYADQVGWPVSTRRAVVMVGVSAAARLLGRGVRPWSVLGGAALVVVLNEPEVVHGLGFGLSFGAVLGMLTVTPRLTRWLPPDLPRPLAWAAEALAVSVGALAGTLPLTAWWFQAVSPLSPLANLVAGPLVGGVAVPGALVAVHGPEALRPLALTVGDGAIGAAVRGLEVLDLPPWAPAVGPVGAAALFAALFVRRRAGLALLAVSLALGAARWLPGTGALTVTVLAVGQGDAVFVRLPDGRRWLVDGGPPSERVLQWLRREGHHHLDAVFLTHPDSDHLGGLEAVVEQLDVDRFVSARPPRTDEVAYRRVWQTLFARGIPVHALGSPLDGPGRLLHPVEGWRAAAGVRGRPRDNDDSLVLLLEHEGRRVLLTGDIERAAEQWLAPRLPTVDVLQAPHHGSRSSSSSGLVVATDPTWVVVSSGVDNRYGHPHAATLAQWRGRRVVRTDQLGTLRIRLEGGSVRVEHSDAGGRYRPVRGRPWSPRPP